MAFMNEPDILHVDDFIDDSFEPWPDIGDSAHARWFFLHRRLPAMLFYSFQKYIEPIHLYCTYEGVRYRVTGASRMGDVWLTTNLLQDTGYEKRVDVRKCTKFSDKL